MCNVHAPLQDIAKFYVPSWKPNHQSFTVTKLSWLVSVTTLYQSKSALLNPKNNATGLINVGKIIFFFLFSVVRHLLHTKIKGCQSHLQCNVIACNYSCTTLLCWFVYTQPLHGLTGLVGLVEQVFVSVYHCTASLSKFCSLRLVFVFSEFWTLFLVPKLWAALSSLLPQACTTRIACMAAISSALYWFIGISEKNECLLLFTCKVFFTWFACRYSIWNVSRCHPAKWPLTLDICAKKKFTDLRAWSFSNSREVSSMVAYLEASTYCYQEMT